jgi:predicted negative regulator of RcsB-dependent stress response
VTQNKKNQPEEPMQDDAHLSVDVEELKRDMRSAKVVAWLQKNQKQLMIGIVLVLLVLAGAGMWAEKQKAVKESAAMVYFQALNQKDDAKRKALLETVIQDYANTSYSILAHMLLAPLADTEKHLRAVMESSSATPELQWQARLDLAEFFIQHDKASDAKSLLNQAVGKQYEQLRFYLLAKISSGDAQIEYLKKALDAISNDDVLKNNIEAELAQAGA